MSFNDNFRHIRSQLQTSGVLASPRLKCRYQTPVITRTETRFLSESPEDYKTHKLCRNKHLDTGFFSVKHQPYKTVGDLIDTDIFEWIAKYFSISAPQLHPYAVSYQSKGLRIHDGEWEHKGQVSSDDIIRVHKTSANKGRSHVTRSLNGGLSSINLEIRANEWSIKEMDAGTSYFDMLTRQKRRKSFLRDSNQPIEHGDLKQIHNPSIYLSSLTNKASDRMCLSTPLKDKQLDTISDKCPPVTARADSSSRRNTAFSNLLVALAATHFKQTSSTKSEARKTRPEVDRSQQQLLKLKTIYLLLCCLHNMKSKDLKSKNPLSPAALKHISQKPLHSLIREFTQDHTHHQILASHRLVSCVNIAKNQPIKTQESHGNFGGQLKGKTDLFSSRTSPSRSIPPWQRTITFTETSEEERKKDHSKRMESCYDEFRILKDELGMQTRETLEEKEQNSEKQLLSKIQSLKYGANIGKELIHMREKAYQTSLLERAKRDNKPNWFILLEQETKTRLRLECTKEGRNILEKINQFIVTDTKSIPHVLEKLCLIVMSLPVYQLCSKPVMEAIKGSSTKWLSNEFLLENVLKTTPNLCNHWLQIRKLPFIS